MEIANTRLFILFCRLTTGPSLMGEERFYFTGIFSTPEDLNHYYVDLNKHYDIVLLNASSDK